MSGFETVLVAALTSAGVALSIEWAAKPRLEARKERILSRHRSASEINRQLYQIRECAIRLSKVQPMGDLTGEQRSTLNSEWNKTIGRLENSARLLDEAMPNLYPQKSYEIYGLMTAYLGLVYGTLGSSNTLVYKGKRISLATQAVSVALNQRAWRFRKRKMLLAIAMDMIKLTEDEMDKMLD